MSKVLSRLLSIVLLFGLSFNIFAADASYAARCNGCTALQKKNAATAIAASYHIDPAATAAGYYGYVYTYDFTAGTIEQYGVVLSQKQAGLVAMPIGPAPADIANAYHIQRNAIQANGSAGIVFEFTGAVSNQSTFPERTATAIDIVQSTSMQNYISGWLTQYAGANNWSIIIAAGSVVLKDQPIVVNVVFTLFDGSIITMQFTAGSSKWKLVDAEDKNLNRIPMVVSDVDGTYRFAHGGADPFGGYLHDRFGYSVGPMCVNGYMACSSVEDQRTCVWVSCNGL